MQPNQLLISTDGFFLNVGVVLLALSEPFMDPNGDKMSKIESGYHMQALNRIDLTNETKLVAAEGELASWVDPRNASRVANYQDQVVQRNQACSSLLERLLTGFHAAKCG